MVDAAAKKYLLHLTAHLVIDAWDGLSVGSIDEKEAEILKHYSLTWFAYEKTQNAQRKIKETQTRNPAYDFELNIVIFPESNRDRTLALVYGENKSFIECFTKHAKVEEYSWWNNCDKPDEVTDAEWDQREKDWQMVVDMPPARAGLSRSYEGAFLPEIKSDEIVACFAPIEKRAERWALDRLVLLYPEEKPKTTGEFYGWLRDARKWAQEGDRMKEMMVTILSEMSTPTAQDINHVPALDFFT